MLNTQNAQNTQKKEKAVNAFKLPRIFLKIFKEHGLEARTILESLGVDCTNLANSLPLIPPHQFGQLIKRIKEVTGEEFLGIKCGLEAGFEEFGVLGLVFSHSSNYKEALLRLQRYKRLIGPERIVLEEGEKTVKIGLSLSCPPFFADEQVIYAGMAFLYAKGKYLTQKNFRPKSVLLTRPPGPTAAIFKNVFGVTPLYNADENALIFDKIVLSYPFISSDLFLGDLLSRECESLVKKMSKQSGLLELTNEALFLSLKRGRVLDVKTLASELNMSVRAFQVKLKKEGTSYREILEKAKRELAFRYLEATELAIAEIAFLLGYSQVESFGRAFKNWSGRTPAYYRAEYLKRKNEA